MVLILFLSLISCPNSSVLVSETMNAKNYIKNKFPSVIYNIYLASLGELDQQSNKGRSCNDIFFRYNCLFSNKCGIARLDPEIPEIL